MPGWLLHAPIQRFILDVAQHWAYLVVSHTQIIAAGFDPKCDLSKCIDKSYDEGGVLILSKADKTKIKSSIRQNPNSLHKFHAFLCYQMEYGYDL